MVLSTHKNEKEIKEIENEVKVLQSLDHPNIIKYYGFFIEKEKYCILMEYAENGLFFFFYFNLLKK